MDPTAAVALRRAQRLVFATSRTPLPPPGRSPTRIETAQRRFLREGNLDLILPLRWAVYGDQYSIVR